MLNIQENVSLKEHSTFKVGGPAKFFCEVTNEEALQEALSWAKESQTKNFYSWRWKQHPFLRFWLQRLGN